MQTVHVIIEAFFQSCEGPINLARYVTHWRKFANLRLEYWYQKQMVKSTLQKQILHVHAWTIVRRC